MAGTTAFVYVLLGGFSLTAFTVWQYARIAIARIRAGQPKTPGA